MKKILSVILITSILACMFSVTVFSKNATITFRIDGKKISSLVPEEDITVEAELPKGCFECKLIVALKKDGVILKGTTKTVSVNDNKATITTPNDVSGCELSAMLWQGYFDITPLASAAIIPSEDNRVTDIVINGEELLDFSPDITEYSKEISEFTLDKPEIFAEAFNSACKVYTETGDDFPGQSLVTSFAPNGLKREYKINYTTDFDSLITDVASTKDENIRIAHNLSDNCNAYSSDSGVYTNISKELKGASYILFGSEYEDSLRSEWTGAPAEWLSFKLKRTADVYILSEEEINVPGFSKVSGLSVKKGSTIQNKAYVKSFGISEGDEREIIINNPSKEALTYTIAIKYKYQAPITELSYLGNEDGTDRNPQLIYAYKDDMSLYTDSVVNKRTVRSTVESENIIGKPAVIFYNMQWDDKNSDAYKNWSVNSPEVKPWYSFKIGRSANIKIYTAREFPALSEYGYNKTSASEKGLGYYARIYDPAWKAYAGIDFVNVYEKHFDVASDSYETVVIPNNKNSSTDAMWGYFAIVDFDEDIISEEAPKVTNIRFNDDILPGFDYPMAELHDGLYDNFYPYMEDTNYKGINVDESVKGKPYIIMKSPSSLAEKYPALGKAWGEKEIEWISFEINQSARIKIITDGDSMAYGNMKYTKSTEDKVYFVRTDGANKTNMKTMYYKDIEVKPGTKERVSVPNTAWFGTTLRPHVVVIDYKD